jgi:hypothetical protein
MKVIHPRIHAAWIGLLAAFTMHGWLVAQTAGSSAVESGSAETLTTFRQQHLALVQQWEALVSQGATWQRVQAWRRQNAAQLQAQQQLAQTIAADSSSQPVPAIAPVAVPPSMSGTLQDFVNTQASLANAAAQIWNQALQTAPSGGSPDQIAQARVQAMKAFQQQHAAELQLHGSRGQALAADSISEPLTAPQSGDAPPNAPPRLLALRAARLALQAAWVQLWNQYRTAAPAARQAAVQQWQQQNAASIQRMRQLAQDLSNSTASQ